ncbi:MAG: acyl-CoA dehydrogenase family protein [Roseovarius sp.]
MSHSAPRDRLGTHVVENQPASRGDLDLWGDDPALQDHAQACGGDAAHLASYGARIGTAQMQDAARLANDIKPRTRMFDTGGRRLDEVEYHPAYHELMQAGISAGYAALPWEGAPGGHASHAAMVYLTAQVEPGVCCPMTMTYAAVPALRAAPDLFAQWVPKLTARVYDSAPKPLARKPGATLGMAMTEKQCGSDLRGITTTATPDGQGYRLNGHKWFCSAPMSDGFLTLAQAPGGLSCFLVPRWLEGTRNGIEIRQLKNKLGNHANASAEIDYVDALAFGVGAEGDGISTIINMVHHTRLDTAMAPAGLMRAALDRACHWAHHRTVFEAQLIDQPLMGRVLADLALDWEGTLALGLHVARAFDGTSPEDKALARLGVALAKFLGNKRAPGVVCDAMEALGGMGYIEDTCLPRLYREAPLNSIWEGAGNVICLDILRTLRTVPLAGEVLGAELGAAAGQYRQYDAALKSHMERFPSLPDEGDALWYASALATLLTASVLIRNAPPCVAEGYVKTRVAGDRGAVAGAVSGLDVPGILGRIAPHVP